MAFTMPPAPAAVAPAVVPEADMMAWKMRVQLSVQRASLLEPNLKSMCALIKG
jgi:hypothetical protein